jgi:Ca2+-binding RTX toxin-like protein
MSAMAYPAGGEFLVNTKTAKAQESPTVAGLADGGFVVTWTDLGGTLGDASVSSVKAQLYDRHGLAVGTEFRVNSMTADGQYNRGVTGLADGGFVVTWQDHSGTLGDASRAAVKAQIFSASGASIGGEMLVNSTTAGNQSLPRIASLAGGGFVAAWQQESGTLGDADYSSIRAQMFSANGTRIGGELRVDTHNALLHLNPCVTGLAGGGFAVSWRNLSDEIKAQLFDASGAKLGGELFVNSQTNGSQYDPAIAGLSDGRIVIAWQDHSSTLGDSSHASIKAQILSATGAKIGGEFLVNSQTFESQLRPVVTALSDGGFVIGWTDLSHTLGDNSGSSVKAQQFSATGGKVGGEFLVNSAIVADQNLGSIAGLADGGFVAAWQGGDGDDWGIKAQRYATAAPDPEGGPLVGTSGNDTLTGTAGDDLLVGLAGHDVLDGAGGIDTASYVGAAQGVKVDLALSGIQNTGGDGKDRLIGIENLVGSAGADSLSGDGQGNRLDGGGKNDVLSGRGGDDHLFGRDGNDLLDGGFGADRLDGGTGNDRYVVDDAGDLVIEADAIDPVTGKDKGGLDWVVASIDFALTAHVEKLSLLDGAGDLAGRGNGLDNSIAGNDGANLLAGGGGKDTLVGGDGADTFLFDVLATSADKDLIKDFVPGSDRIALAGTVFLAFAGHEAGVLAPEELVIGAKATTANQHLVYNPASGALFYDADGAGGVAQVQIASLSGHPLLSAGDVFIV